LEGWQREILFRIEKAYHSCMQQALNMKEITQDKEFEKCNPWKLEKRRKCIPGLEPWG
jgi:hypothetical protein